MRTKNTLKVFAIGFIILIQACSKNEDNIKIQKHDDNQMMAIMHQMMDDMMKMPVVNDPDNAFAMMMKMHHQGAINMANLEIKSGSDATMKAMAQSIIDSQQKEIVELSSFLESHPADSNDPELAKMQMMTMEKGKKQADLQIINGNIDHDFATLMIGHHQSAIENSRLLLVRGKENRMKTLANMIITAQQDEIGKFQDWLLARGQK